MTRLLVLGMLDAQPMSGYDIQQALQMTDAERWGGVLIGSIYHALKKMEQEGVVEVASMEQTGHRQKAIYAITPAGRQYLQTLLYEALKTPPPLYPSTFYSALSFCDKLPAAQCCEALRLQGAALQREYEAVERGLQAKDDAMQHNIPPLVRLIMDHMFTVVRQQQQFVEDALRLLENEA